MMYLASYLASKYGHFYAHDEAVWNPELSSTMDTC